MSDDRTTRTRTPDEPRRPEGVDGPEDLLARLRPGGDLWVDAEEHRLIQRRLDYEIDRRLLEILRPPRRRGWRRVVDVLLG